MKSLKEGNLHKWFNSSKSKDGKKGWVNVTTGGTCASDEKGEGTPKCVSSSKRASMTKAERRSASQRKKKADPGQQSKTGAAKPTYVSTDKKKMKESKDLEVIAKELDGASKMHKKQAKRVRKHIQDMHTEEKKPRNCGCGKDPCITYGKGGSKEKMKESKTFVEKCWDGYTQKGMKKKGKRVVPNCVKESDLQLIWEKARKKAEKKTIKRWWDDDGDGIGYEKGEVKEGYGKKKKKKKHNCASKVKHEEFGIGDCITGMHTLDENNVVTHYDVEFEEYIVENCPVEELEIIQEGMHEHYENEEKNAEVFSESDKKGKGSGKKDACYKKVKASAKVWPSAYASGRLVQCRKKGAANYGNSKSESYSWRDDFEFIEEGAAWTKKAGKNKKGGLNEKGRKSYERENPGSDLKAPSKKPGNKRRASFCARMKGMKKKLTSKKTARDPDSRINKSLRAWNC